MVIKLDALIGACEESIEKVLCSRHLEKGLQLMMAVLVLVTPLWSVYAGITGALEGEIGRGLARMGVGFVGTFFLYCLYRADYPRHR